MMMLFTAILNLKLVHDANAIDTEGKQLPGKRGREEIMTAERIRSNEERNI